MLHGHGDDAYRHDRPVTANFSTNVWHGGPPPGLEAVLTACWRATLRYPEPDGASFAHAAAAHHGLDPRRVLAVNGTTEAIYLIAQAFRTACTRIVTPTFAEYEDAARLHGHRLRFAHWMRPEWHDAPPDADLVFLCNPNNPTGNAAPAGVVLGLARRYPRTVFVVDEAYIDFTREAETVVPFVREVENLLVLRSLTKAYALPGLRLGYVVGAPGLVERVAAYRSPWSVNALALEVGCWLLEKHPRPSWDLDAALAEARAFQESVAALDGFYAAPTTTTFFLAHTEHGTAAALKEHLVHEHGFLIRDAANFRGLTPQHFRLAALRPAQNRRLLEALAAWTPSS